MTDETNKVLQIIAEKKAGYLELMNASRRSMDSSAYWSCGAYDACTEIEKAIHAAISKAEA